jgi:archaemetzincin
LFNNLLMDARLLHLYPIDLQRPDLELVDWLGSELAPRLSVISVAHAELPVPPDSKDELRRQWLSNRLVETIYDRGKSDGALPGEWLLGIAAVDLFAPERDFVFGEAELGGACAVVSVARMREPGLSDDTEVVRSRLLREALHEIGHLAGIQHCTHGSCVMQLSEGTADIDRKPASYCADCARRMAPG